MKKLLLYFLANWLAAITVASVLALLILRLIESLLARFLCLLLLIKFNWPIQIKTVSISFVWAAIRLRNVQFCLHGVGVCFLKEIHISFLRKGKALSIWIKGFVLKIPLTGASSGINPNRLPKKLIASIAANSVFKLDQASVVFEAPNLSYTLQAELLLIGLARPEQPSSPETTSSLEEDPNVDESLVCKAFELKFSAVSSGLENTHLMICETSVLKVQVYFGALPTYLIPGACNTTCSVIPCLIAQIVVDSHLSLYADIRSDMLTEHLAYIWERLSLYLPDNRTVILRVRMQGIEVRLGRSWRLSSRPTSGFSCLEVAQVYRQDRPVVEVLASSRIDQVEWHSSEAIFCRIKSVKVFLRFDSFYLNYIHKNTQVL